MKPTGYNAVIKFRDGRKIVTRLFAGDNRGEEFVCVDGVWKEWADWVVDADVDTDVELVEDEG